MGGRADMDLFERICNLYTCMTRISGRALLDRLSRLVADLIAWYSLEVFPYRQRYKAGAVLWSRSTTRAAHERPQSTACGEEDSGSQHLPRERESKAVCVSA